MRCLSPGFPSAVHLSGPALGHNRFAERGGGGASGEAGSSQSHCGFLPLDGGVSHGGGGHSPEDGGLAHRHGGLPPGDGGVAHG